MLPAFAPVGRIGRSAAARKAMKSVAIAASEHLTNYLLEKALDSGIAWIGEQLGVDVSDEDTATLVGGLTVTDVRNISQEILDQANRAIQEIVNRGEEAVESMDAHFKAQMLNNASEQTARRLSQLSETDADMLRRICLTPGINKDSLPDDARRALNSVTRRSTDGQRVSREFHEFQYCLNSGQILEVFTTGQVAPPSELRYGAFVDSNLMRKAIEQLRRLRRATHAKNARAITDLLGTTPGQLYLQLRNAPAVQQQMGAAANQMKSFS